MTDWDRARTIWACQVGPESMKEVMISNLYHEIADGIVDKLREFNKYKVVQLPDDLISMSCSLTIIVPYPSSSKRPIPSVPPPE